MYFLVHLLLLNIKDIRYFSIIKTLLKHLLNTLYFTLTIPYVYSVTFYNKVIYVKRCSF